MEKGGVLREIEFEPAVITKIRQREMGNMHKVYFNKIRHSCDASFTMLSYALEYLINSRGWAGSAGF
jgi:hypothetical protein